MRWSVDLILEVPSHYVDSENIIFIDTKYLPVRCCEMKIPTGADWPSRMMMSSMDTNHLLNISHLPSVNYSFQCKMAALCVHVLSSIVT